VAPCWWQRGIRPARSVKESCGLGRRPHLCWKFCGLISQTSFFCLPNFSAPPWACAARSGQTGGGLREERGADSAAPLRRCSPGLGETAAPARAAGGLGPAELREAGAGVREGRGYPLGTGSPALGCCDSGRSRHVGSAERQ